MCQIVAQEEDGNVKSLSGPAEDARVPMIRRATGKDTVALIGAPFAGNVDVERRKTT